MIVEKLKNLLEEKILKTLITRWYTLWCELPEDVKKRLKEPQMSLFYDPSGGAEYIPESNLIRFTKTCVKNLSWKSIENTLRHEMSHQLACTYSEYQYEDIHGQLFKKCCDILKCDPTRVPVVVNWKCFESKIKNKNDLILRKINYLIKFIETKDKKKEAACKKVLHLINMLHKDLLVGP